MLISHQPVLSKGGEILHIDVSIIIQIALDGLDSVLLDAHRKIYCVLIISSDAFDCAVSTDSYFSSAAIVLINEFASAIEASMSLMSDATFDSIVTSSP